MITFPLHASTPVLAYALAAVVGVSLLSATAGRATGNQTLQEEVAHAPGNVDAATIRASMAANDAQVLNGFLKYRLSKWNPPRSQPALPVNTANEADESPYPQFSSVKLSLENIPGRVKFLPYHVEYEELIAIRGAESAGRRRLEPAEVSAQENLESHRWSVLGGEVKEVTAITGSKPGKVLEWVTATTRDPNSVTVFHEYIDKVKWLCGVGFEEYLDGPIHVTILSGSRDGSIRYELRGDVRIARGSRGKCKLELDDDLIVRKAELTFGSGTDSVTTIEISTEGRREWPDQAFRCAERGRLVEFRGPQRVGRKELVSELQDITFGISDAAWNKHVDIAAPTDARTFYMNLDEPRTLHKCDLTHDHSRGRVNDSR